MKEEIQKLKSVVSALEQSHGQLLIFALFLREEPLEKWDIIVSAPWLDSSELSSYTIVSSEIKKTLTDSELMQFSRIVILNPNDAVVSYIQDLKTITNGGFELLEAPVLSEHFGFTIKKAYLLRSQKIN
jgi:hypothetical protein